MCTYWQEGKHYIGHLNDYPDYQTQGESFDELMDHLRDIAKDLEAGLVEHARKVVALEL